MSGMQVSMQGGRVLEMCEPVAEMPVGYLGCVTLWSHWQVGGVAGVGRRGCRQ